jgi:hypothetical protein
VVRRGHRFRRLGALEDEYGLDRPARRNLLTRWGESEGPLWVMARSRIGLVVDSSRLIQPVLQSVQTKRVFSLNGFRTHRSVRLRCRSVGS